MVHYVDFGRLHLAQFLPPATEITALDYWEFMGRLWVGEAVGFTEFLRLRCAPDVTRSIAIDLGALPREISAPILVAIDLPLVQGMSIQQVCNVLRAEPTRVHQFTKDRDSYDFEIGGDEGYDVSCTVLHDGGLAYVVMMRHDYQATPIEA
jgi:hypothetical protein